MDKCSSDADFDSYWEYESKNKNRNRIRVGRQYQASVPPLLKPGEKDDRKCEDLETLKWMPGKLSEQRVDQYLSMAKAVTLLAKSLDTYIASDKVVEKPIQTALKGLSEFVTSHHPYHHDSGCQVTNPEPSGESSSRRSSTNEWTPTEVHLFAQALEANGKNFCAIKKDFLPWKPVRSIIEYYYQNKGEKSEASSPDMPNVSSSNHIDEIKPVPSCSYTSEGVIERSHETKETEDMNSVEESKNIMVNCEDGKSAKELKVEPTSGSDTEKPLSDSSTVGSLKFYLGGRLVLKLNAQQDSDSGSKCQWVQSNDTPKLCTLIKKVKHRKKIFQDPLAMCYENQTFKNKPERSAFDSDLSDQDALTVKKPKLKAECEKYSEQSTSFSVLQSTSWTPPVADGQDAVEMEDGSSKASEGCISPVYSNSVCEKTEIKCDASIDMENNSTNSINCEDRVKTESPTDDISLSHLENKTFTNSLNSCFSTDKCTSSHFIDPNGCKELLSHWNSAANKMKIESCPFSFSPKNALTCSLYKTQWPKWSNSSGNAKSCVNLTDTFIDVPLDLSPNVGNSLLLSKKDKCPAISASNHNSNTGDCCDEHHNVSLDNRQTSDCIVINEDLSHQSKSSNDCCTSNIDEQTKCFVTYGSEDDSCICVNDSNQICCAQHAKNEETDKNSGNFYYSYYNLPCSCVTPKSLALAVAEMPLDLSSTCENIKTERSITDVPDKEAESSPNHADVHGKGMLYQLLQNKNK